MSPADRDTPGAAGSGRVAGRVALVTGAARGQGRAEAVMLAAEGADVIGIDLCGPVATVGYAPATADDLAETARLVERQGGRFQPARVDVRDLPALTEAVTAATRELGRLDIVVANAGISTWGRVWELTSEQWQVMLDVNLTGVWHTLKATVPLLLDQGNGGSIVVTSSVGGLKGLPGQAHYVAAKHGLVGLVRAAAVELGPYNIRVNSIHPWGVDTHMVLDSERIIGGLVAQCANYGVSYASALAEPGLATPEDIARTVLYLASDDSRCTTGAQLTVDMGATKV